jgi:hypothetical protein
MSWTQRGRGLRMSSSAGCRRSSKRRLEPPGPGGHSPHHLTGDSACLSIRDHRLLPLPAPMWRHGATPGQSRGRAWPRARGVFLLLWTSCGLGWTAEVGESSDGRQALPGIGPRPGCHRSASGHGHLAGVLRAQPRGFAFWISVRPGMVLCDFCYQAARVLATDISCAACGQPAGDPGTGAVVVARVAPWLGAHSICAHGVRSWICATPGTPADRAAALPGGRAAVAGVSCASC